MPDPATVPGPELPRALVAALRRFGPSWLRYVRGQVGHGGPSPSRLLLLGHLAQAGRPLIMRQLTQALGTTARAVTGLVDALEAEGLVRREPHPRDRRATLVALDDRGREVLAGQHGAGLAGAAELFAVLSEADQRALLRILGQLSEALDGRGDA